VAILAVTPNVAVTHQLCKIKISVLNLNRLFFSSLHSIDPQNLSIKLQAVVHFYLLRLPEERSTSVVPLISLAMMPLSSSFDILLYK